MSVRKVVKDEQAKIEATENKSLPFNESEYEDIANTQSSCQKTKNNNSFFIHAG